MAKITIEELSDSLKEQLLDVKLYYPIETSYVFENFTNIEGDVVPGSSSNLFDIYKFQGEMPIPEAPESAVYILRIIIDDNRKLYTAGPLARKDNETGSIYTFAESVFSDFELRNEMTVGLIIDGNVSGNLSNLVFEKNNNILTFGYPNGENPNLLPTKMEIVTMPMAEFTPGIPESGLNDEIIDYIDSFFKTKTLEINDEFFKTHKFVTQDMINDIGNADNLATNDKTIVGAINELFQYGNNVKQQLVDILVAKKYELSTNITWNDLINLISEKLPEKQIIMIPGDQYTLASTPGGFNSYYVLDMSRENSYSLSINVLSVPSVTHIQGVRLYTTVATDEYVTMTIYAQVSVTRNNSVIYKSSLLSLLYKGSYGGTAAIDITGINDIQSGDVIDILYGSTSNLTGGELSGPPRGAGVEFTSVSVKCSVDSATDSVEPKKMVYGTDNVLVSSDGYEVRTLSTAASDTLVIPALPYDFEGATLYMKGKTTGTASDNIWFRINILDSDNNSVKRINDDYLLFKNTDTEFTFNIDTLQAGYKVYVEATIYNPYEPMSIATEDPTLIATVSEISIRYNLK